MTEIPKRDSQFFSNVLDMVRKIPIEEIVYDIYHIPKGICPFHRDRHAGSFSIIKKYNRYHCFSCGAKGDGITFVRNREELSFEDAVWKLALQFDIVSKGQMDSYLKGTLTNQLVNTPPRVYDRIFEDKEEPEIANDEILHHVFSVFAEGEGLIRENKKLSKKHRTHLQKERQLTDKEIERAGYFTIPNRSRLFMQEFLRVLKERYGYEEDILNDVPGFYWVNKLGGMTFVSHKGIGIPVRNERGQIVGIQIRRDKVEEGESRYVWFSSSFANEKEGMKYGTGSGSPIHVSYPVVNRRPSHVFITEGVFKSEQLAKFYQAICISIQGVQNGKGKVDRLIDYLEEEQGIAVHRFHFFFDADVCENIHVYTAFRELYLSLQRQYPFMNYFYYWWKPEYGKGIDDLIFNQLAGEVHYIDCKQYVRAYDKMIADLEKQYGLPRQELDKELIFMTFKNKIAPLFRRLNPKEVSM